MTPWRCFLVSFRQCCTDMACAPFFLLAILFYSFYYCWPYDTQLPEHIYAAIVDEDQSSLSRRLTLSLRATPRLEIKGLYVNRPKAVDAMKREEVNAVLTIPRGFAGDALAGNRAAISLAADGAFIVKSRVAIGGAADALAADGAEIVAGRALAYGAAPTNLALESMRAPNLAVDLKYNTIAGYMNFVVPIVFMIIFQTLMICGTGMLYNDWFVNSRPIMRDMLENPVCLVAAQAPVFCICFFWSILVEGAIFGLHDINSFQNIPATVAAGFFFALAIAALGAFVGLALGRLRYVIQVVVPSSLPAVFITGNLWPEQNIPFALRVFGWFLPSSAGSDAVLRASQAGASLSQIYPYLLRLFALFALYLGLALLVARVRRRYFNAVGD